jgi:hypothetical protein
MKPFLKKALIGNALFSEIGGILILALHHTFCEIMNISNESVFIFIGIGLLLFSAFIWLVLLKKKLSKFLIRLIIFQDWTWVLFSTLILLDTTIGISQQGKINIAIVSFVVMLLALLQYRGLKLHY